MTTALRSTMALAAATLALAACESDPAPSARRPTSQAAAPAEPQGPVTRYDGRYVGSLTLNPDRTRACPTNEGSDRVLTVTQGRASFLVVPQSRLTLHGAVRSDGSLSVNDLVDRSIATTGSFDGNRFSGLYRNGLCTYAVQLTKRD